MKKAFCLILVLAGVLALGSLAGQVEAVAGNLDVAASPAVLNLRSAGGATSLHTDVAASAVRAVTLKVDGIEVTDFRTFADARGQLVVRVDIDLIKDLVACPSATFALAVNTGNGDLSGTDTIRVIDVGR